MRDVFMYAVAACVERATLALCEYAAILSRLWWRQLELLLVHTLYLTFVLTQPSSSLAAFLPLPLGYHSVRIVYFDL
jgi:hypothetical protein